MGRGFAMSVGGRFDGFDWVVGGGGNEMLGDGGFEGELDEIRGRDSRLIENMLKRVDMEALFGRRDAAVLLRKSMVGNVQTLCANVRKEKTTANPSKFSYTQTLHTYGITHRRTRKVEFPLIHCNSYLPGVSTRDTLDSSRSRIYKLINLLSVRINTMEWLPQPRF